MSNNEGFKALAETLKQSKDTIAEVLDAGLEAAESIPFFGWAVKVWNIRNTFHEKKLYRNTKAFWENSLINSPDELFSKFTTDQERADFVDTLTQVLIDSEKPYKAKMVSNITTALAKGIISPSDANDMNLIVLSSSVPALKSLPPFYRRLQGGRYIHTTELEETDRDGAYSMINSMGLLYKIADHTALSQLGSTLARIAYRDL